MERILKFYVYLFINGTLFYGIPPTLCKFNYLIEWALLTYLYYVFLELSYRKLYYYLIINSSYSYYYYLWYLFVISEKLTTENVPPFWLYLNLLNLFLKCVYFLNYDISGAISILRLEERWFFIKPVHFSTYYYH